jgi:hypothetical protein
MQVDPYERPSAREALVHPVSNPFLELDDALTPRTVAHAYPATSRYRRSYAGTAARDKRPGSHPRSASTHVEA